MRPATGKWHRGVKSGAQERAFHRSNPVRTAGCGRPCHICRLHFLLVNNQYLDRSSAVVPWP